MMLPSGLINMLRTHILKAVLGAAFIAPNAYAEQPQRALHGHKVYISPHAPILHDAVILIRGGKIERVLPAREAQTVAPLDRGCDGGVIVAGFQNSHVHLLGKVFEAAAGAPADRLAGGLKTLLTGYGFTTAFDLASDRDNTLALRRRIDKGEVPGPRILTAGWPLFPVDGLPSYIDGLNATLRSRLPQPASVEAATAVVRQNLDAGAEATKLFLVTPQAGQGLRRMRPDIAAAAVDETHRRGRLVFAHPTDMDGLRAALASKVDILAHPPLGASAPWNPSLMTELRERGISMVPTLKLLRYELNKENVPPTQAEQILTETVSEFGKFVAAGGQVLFGTDVDYMSDADPTEEYTLMARAGMSARAILASLTTTPAQRWNEAARRGRLMPGMDADLVVLQADPADSVANFARVRCTVRQGEVIFRH